MAKNKHRTHGYRPSFEDFFPSRARGTSYRDGAADGRDGAADGRDGNMKAWREERGIGQSAAVTERAIKKAGRVAA
jgi:hypothetical protein